MNNEQLYLTKLLCNTINRKAVEPPENTIDWLLLTNCAISHNVLPIIFPSVSKLGEESGVRADLLDVWKRYSFKSGITQMTNRGYLIQLIKELNSNNIPVLMVKGPILSNLYPEPTARATVDADILVAEEDVEATSKIFTDVLGYEKEYNESNENVYTYRYNGFNVELHVCLWEDHSGERYEKLTSLNIVDFNKFSDYTFNGCTVKIMCETDSLFYFFFHMIKHFFIKGIGIRYISDITVYIKENHDKIDWDDFWKKAATLNYTDFCLKFFYLCIKYMGLDSTMVKGAKIDDSLDEVATMLLEDMLEGGHNGYATAVRYGASGMMWSYYNEKNFSVPKKASMLSMVKLFFKKCAAKRPENVSGKKYSENIVIRAFQYAGYLISDLNQRKKERGSTAEIIEVTNKRVNLVKDLGLFHD